jgi:hypothetical protein
MLDTAQPRKYIVFWEYIQIYKKIRLLKEQISSKARPCGKDEPANSTGNLNDSFKNLFKQKHNDMQRKLKIEIVLHHCNYSSSAFI